MKESLEKLLRSFDVYYDVKREGVTAPFAAEAEFHSHDEQFFLVRSARLSEAESNEYVFFAAPEKLNQSTLELLDQTAWERGQERIKPHKDHRNSDVVLVILADQITEEAMERIPQLRRYKSYRLGLQGWSHYRVIAFETSSGRTVYNRQGRNLEKLIGNIK